MSKPRQLAPTVGPAHGGVEFLEGAFLGFEKIAIGQVTKSGRGRIYINFEFRLKKFQHPHKRNQREKVSLIAAYIRYG